VQPKITQLKNEEQTSSPAKTITYTVQPKESLYGISKKYGVTVDDIKKWNNLTSDNLKI
jgi:membrane-bound lytic murein transglycosylase D